MRLIDADAVVKRLEEWNTNDSMDKALYNFTLCRITEQPTIEPERKTGKWHPRIYSHIEMMVCSECNSEFSYDAETGVRDYNYCPHCGARMEVEHENTLSMQ